MEYSREGSTSVYDYADRSIQQAGYAAIVYAVVSMVSTGLAWFQAPSTPLLALTVMAVIIGVFFGGLAFGIFKKSRVCVVIMLVLVVGFQLYTWFVLRSASGSLLSVIATGFLLRGARRIFQDHAERRSEGDKAPS
jgi:hypothetical protein